MKLYSHHDAANNRYIIKHRKIHTHKMTITIIAMTMTLRK